MGASGKTGTGFGTDASAVFLPGGAKLSRHYDKLIDGLASIAGLIIATICVLIVYDVVARNLGLQPPASTVALTEYALLYVTMAAAPWLVRERGHIVVEVFYQRLPHRLQRALRSGVPLLCAAISLLIATIATLLAAEAAARGEIEVRSLDTPRWVLFAPLVVGFGLMAVEFLRIAVSGGSVYPSDETRRSRQSF